MKAGQHHQLDFNELKDIATLWKEYSEGINGGPALRDLEAQGKKWRCIGNSAGKGACRQRWSVSLPFYKEIQFRVARGDSETAAVAAVQLMLDDKMRKQQLPNLTRYMSLNLQIQHFKLAFGSITFCVKALSPNFELEFKKEKKPQKDEKKS